jgi:hypothetical protein
MRTMSVALKQDGVDRPVRCFMTRCPSSNQDAQQGRLSFALARRIEAIAPWPHRRTALQIQSEPPHAPKRWVRHNMKDACSALAAIGF